MMNFNDFLYKPLIIIEKRRAKYKISVGTLIAFYSQELLLYTPDGRTTRIPKPVMRSDILIPLDRGVSEDKLKELKQKLERLLIDAGRRVYRYTNTNSHHLGHNKT